VTTCFSLGKSFVETATSEAQKKQVLRAAKNLKLLSNELEKMFIHQDLTQRQREAWQQLVKIMRERKAKGEFNLIIVGDKIITCRLNLVAT